MTKLGCKMAKVFNSLSISKSLCSKITLHKKFIIVYFVLFFFFFQNVIFLDSHFSISKKDKKPHSSLHYDWENLVKDEQTNGRDVVADENQNLYVVGNIFNSSKNAYDVLMSKYNSSGIMLWNVSWGGALNDYAYAIDINKSSSDIYVVGRTTSYGTDGSNDIFLLSYNSSGILQRNITWGGNNWDVGYDIKCTTNFTYAIGYSNSFSTSEDIIVLKYNSSYSLLWNKSYGTSEKDIGYGITINNTNSILITGKTTSIGNEDLILLELDSDGNQLWNTTWGGSNSDEGRSLLVNSFDEIFVLGNTRSFGAGSTDFALLKFNSTGGLTWQHIWGGPDIDTGYKLINDSYYNLFLIGYTESYGLSGKDACIVKYNSSGGYHWYKTRMDSSEDIAYSGFIDINDNLYITGKANNQLFLTKFNPLPSTFNLMHNTSNPDTDGTFIVDWTESLDAINYTLYQWNSSITEINSSIDKVVEGNTNRTITFNNLEEGIYHFIVVAYNGYGNTTSNLISITVQYLPGNFYLSHDAEFPDKDGTVNFTWTPSQGADSYELYINDLKYKDNITDNSYIVDDLDTNDYSVFIIAINEAGKCSISVRRSPTLFSLSTNAGNPDADGRFELIWAKSSFTSYYIIYNSSIFISEVNSTVSILYNHTPSLDLPTYRYNLSGLTNGTYYYKIIAFNQYGNYSTECVQIRVVILSIPLELEDDDEFIFPQEIVMYSIFVIFFGLLIFVYIKLKK